MRTPRCLSIMGTSPRTRVARFATTNSVMAGLLVAIFALLAPRAAIAQDAGVPSDAGDAGTTRQTPPPPLSPTAAGSTIPVLAGQVVAQTQRANAAEARERDLQAQLADCNRRAGDLQRQVDDCNRRQCSDSERQQLTTQITQISTRVTQIRRDLRAIRAELREIRGIAEGARDDARRANDGVTRLDGVVENELRPNIRRAQETADNAQADADDAQETADNAQHTADGAVAVNTQQASALTRHEAAIRGVNTAVRALTRLVPEGYALASLNILVPTQSGRDTVLGGGLQIGTTWYPSSGSWVTFDIAGSVSPFRGVALATFGGGLMGGGRAGESVLLGAGLRLLNLQVTDRIAPANGQDGLAAGSLGWMITPSVRATYAPRDSRFRCGLDLGVGIGGSLGTHVMLNLGCGAAFNATAESVTSSLRDPGPPPAATQN